jgi:hypothetical protein
MLAACAFRQRRLQREVRSGADSVLDFKVVGISTVAGVLPVGCTVVCSLGSGPRAA